MLVCSVYGAVAGTIFRIITELGVFVVQGWTGDMATGVEWSGPTGIMTACRRSLVTITVTGLATLKVGELTQMLVSGGGNAGSGRRPARCRRRRWGASQRREECDGGGAGVRRDLGRADARGAASTRRDRGAVSLVILVLGLLLVRLAWAPQPKPLVVRVDEVGRAEPVTYETMEAQAVYRGELRQA